MHLSRSDPCDLKTEIAQLKFQILKLNEDCADLRKQNSTFQDENILLMVSYVNWMKQHY